MKKLLITLGLVSLMMLGTTAFAGNEFGFKGGLNMANFSGDVEGTDTRTGFGGGLFFKINMPNGNFAFQPEVLYVMKGAKGTEDMEGTVVDVEYKMNYIEVPVLVKYNFPTQGKIKPNLFLGPFIGFLMTSKVEATAEGISAEVDMKDITKSVEFGSTFGGGVDIMVGPKGKLSFDARYSLGLSNIVDDGSEDDVKNNVFSFYLGYSMGLGQ